MQLKNISLKLNLGIEDGILSFNSNLTKLNFNYINEQVVFNDNGFNDTSFIRFNQTSNNDVIFKINDGNILLQNDEFVNKFKIGVTNNEGIIEQENDISLNPNNSQGTGNVNITGLLNFSTLNSSIKYNGNEFLKFKGEGNTQSSQILFDQGWQLQLGSGNQQSEVFSNELNGTDNNKKVFIAQENEIHFYTNIENGWINKKSQYIDSTGKYNGLVTRQEKLNTQRTIELSGDVVGFQNFDGTQNIVISQEVEDDSHFHDSEYYSKSKLQTSGQSMVHFDNITNVPSFSLDTHLHDDRYYTETEIDNQFNQHLIVQDAHHSRYTDQETISAIETGILTTGINFEFPVSQIEDNQFTLLCNENNIKMYIGQNGDSYGFYWIYTGTNIGNEKSLDFYTQNGTSINDINVYSIKQDGIFNIKTSLNVDGNITGQNIKDGNWNYQFTHSQIIVGNPHNISKEDIGLQNVPNTNIAYSSTIPADQFTTTEVTNLKQQELSDGTTPWATKLEQTHEGRRGDVHQEVSESINGFMIAQDKVKLNSIEMNANNYVHPQTHPQTMIQTDSFNRFVSDQQIEEWTNKLKVLKSITLNVQNWVDDTQGASGYWYYDIQDTIINTNSFIELFFSFNSQQYIDDIKPFNESMEGFVRIYQDSQPENDIICSVKIIN